MTDSELQRNLLAWYDIHGRTLPWRIRGRPHDDPYHVLLSEIMLQQTTVPTVIPYFHRFLEKWPTLPDLSAAVIDDILVAWQGLGYYRRAHNLKSLADYVVTNHDGRLPPSHAALRALPGIGPYTASAIAAIGFGLPFVPVDGNIIRVFSRYYGVDDPLPALKTIIPHYADRHASTPRPFDFAQALMDLGSFVCTKSAPVCTACPLNAGCVAFFQNLQHVLPKKDQKASKPKKSAHSLVILWKDQVLLRKRSDRGLLSGMMETPSSPWDIVPANEQDFFLEWGFNSSTITSHNAITHTFTHFHLTVHVWSVTLSDADVRILNLNGGSFYDIASLRDVALPTLFKKILNKAL